MRLESAELCSRAQRACRIFLPRISAEGKNVGVYTYPAGSRKVHSEPEILRYGSFLSPLEGEAYIFHY